MKEQKAKVEIRPATVRDAKGFVFQCEECGIGVITWDATLISDWEVINGKLYCDTCERFIKAQFEKEGNNDNA